MAIEIIRPGMLTTIQDPGRDGFAAEGFPACGACDKPAFALANLMCGNGFREAALECTCIGPAIRFTEDAIITVTHAAAELNGRQIPEGEPVLVLAGDELAVTRIRGMRAYVAVHGGLDVPLVRGSRSTDLKCRIGGYQGRALVQGDVIPTTACDVTKLYPRLRDRAERAGVLYLPDPLDEPVIRVIKGPQDDMFTEDGCRTFFTSVYTVVPESNRMGIRLTGEPIGSLSGTDILSDAIVEGSVQVAADGLPIIMLADHQTTGGYAKIATVIPTDLPVLAQLAPGRRIRFQPIEPEQALALYRTTAGKLRLLHERMAITDETDRSERRPGRKLRCLHHRHG